jgi:glycerol-3-phosphate dehydrogenase
MQDCDLLIIGGGINGAGIARDAAGRGLSAVLVEQDDLAAHTSSASTKLIHGGLRYLEQYEFRLVREALQERERLLFIAPHIIWPLRFVLPHSPEMRPAWLLRVGLFLYDHIGGRRTLPGTETLKLDGTGLGDGLASRVKRGFAYSDCWVEDSRLVVLNAADAATRGARILTHTRLLEANREGALWHAVLRDTTSSAETRLRAKMLVNAAGPWVAEVLGTRLGLNSQRRTRLVKGSHIVVKRHYRGEHAYILQNPDRRIVFAIPYERRYTLIGTTDEPYEVDPSRPEIAPDETAYLLESASRWFAEPIKASEIVWHYAGVRALFDNGAKDASEVTRDYVLDLDAPDGRAKLLSVFGGKITTFRRLAEHALDKLGVPGASWTATVPLPGGDIPDGNFALFAHDLASQHRYLPATLAYRLARAYGTRARKILGTATTMAALGEDFGVGLTAAEVDYLVHEEFARTADDILWRRSKLGLHAPPDTAARLAAYLEEA